jgi:hypothetical protein
MTRALVGLVLVLQVVACQADGPTSATEPPVADAVAFLEIEARPSLIVHEMALFTVVARSADGRGLAVPGNLTWGTSDATVATVSSLGVVTARDRGTARIGVRLGAVRGEVTVNVKARVKITPTWRYRPCTECDGQRQAFFSGEASWRLAVGDTLQLSASYTDIDGVPLGGAVTATWTSSRPDDVSVSVDGDVVGLTFPGLGADITVATEDGVDQVRVYTTSTIAGLPATLRLAHAAIGLGPVTFLHNKGAPVTLSFGESVDLPITSGLFYLDAQGLPAPDSIYANYQTFGALVLGGDRLAIYAIGGDGVPQSSVVGAWDTPTIVPGDSVRVRLVQGWTSAGVVYVLPAAAPENGLPELCYFDPGNTWGYVERPVGELDFVMKAKYGPQFTPVRIRVSPEPGQSVTYVITQSAVHPLGVVAFPDR